MSGRARNPPPRTQAPPVAEAADDADVTEYDLLDSGAGGFGDDELAQETKGARFAGEAAYLAGRTSRAEYLAAFEQWAAQQGSPDAERREDLLPSASVKASAQGQPEAPPLDAPSSPQQAMVEGGGLYAGLDAPKPTGSDLPGYGVAAPKLEGSDLPGFGMDARVHPRQLIKSDLPGYGMDAEVHPDDPDRPRYKGDPQGVLEQAGVWAGNALALPHEGAWWVHDKITGESSPLPAVERTYRAAPDSQFLVHAGLVNRYGPAAEAPLVSWVPGQGLARVAVDGRIQGWREWVEGGGSLAQFAAPVAGKAVGGVSKAVLNVTRPRPSWWRAERRTGLPHHRARRRPPRRSAGGHPAASGGAAHPLHTAAHDTGAAPRPVDAPHGSDARRSPRSVVGVSEGLPSARPDGAVASRGACSRRTGPAA